METATRSAMRCICACVISAALILTAQAASQSSAAPVEQLKTALAANEHLHISKLQYKPEDHKLFEALVRSVKFEDK
jgi:hypothetical protein